MTLMRQSWLQLVQIDDCHLRPRGHRFSHGNDSHLTPRAVLLV